MHSSEESVGRCNTACKGLSVHQLCNAVLDYTGHAVAEVDFVSLSKMLSLTPARVMGYTDRGSIEVGKRADLLIIDENLKGWSFSRLNKVDKAILRLATYEMKFCQETPHKIIIDEAVELTKEFSDTGDGKARSFNNKVLDQISKHFA